MPLEKLLSADQVCPKVSTYAGPPEFTRMGVKALVTVTVPGKIVTLADPVAPPAPLAVTTTVCAEEMEDGVV